MSALYISPQDEYLRVVRQLHDVAEDEFDILRCLHDFPVVRSMLDHANATGFLLDYRTGKYYYFGDNAGQMIGYSSETFMQEGLDLTKSVYRPEDAAIYYNEINQSRQEFLRSVSPMEMLQYGFRHTFRVVRKDKQEISVMQQHMVLKADAKGKPLVIIGFCTDLTGIKTDTKVIDNILKFEPGKLPTLVQVNQYFPRPEEGALSVREIEVLKWVLEGLSSEAIADKMFISVHTVRTHRKHMLEKTNAKNTADLIRYAVKNGLI